MSSLPETVKSDPFFNLSPDLMCVAGFDGYFKRLNPAWEETLGLSLTELKAAPFIDFVHPDDQTRTQAEVVRLTMGFNRISFENRYRRRDGSYLWLQWNASMSLEDQLIYAVARDITQRKAAEEALQRRTTLLQLLKDVAQAIQGTASLMASLRTVISLVCSQLDWPLGRAYLVAGEAGGQLAPTSIWYPVAPGRFEAFREETLAALFMSDQDLLDQALRDGWAYWLHDVNETAGTQARHANDTPTIKSGIAFPVRIKQDVVAVMAFFADRTIDPDPLMLNVLEQISSQVISQAIERQRLEERFRALVHHAADLIAILSETGGIEYISPAVQAIIGQPPAALIGQNILDYVHPDDLAMARTGLALLVREPIALMQLKLRLRHADGSWRSLELTGNNWLGLHAVNGLIINGCDVTDMEYICQALRDLEESLRQNEVGHEVVA